MRIELRGCVVDYSRLELLIIASVESAHLYKRYERKKGRKACTIFFHINTNIQCRFLRLSTFLEEFNSYVYRIMMQVFTVSRESMPVSKSRRRTIDLKVS